MRKNIKKKIDEIIVLLEEAQKELLDAIVNGDTENIFELLECCQNGAMQVGNTLEEHEGEGLITVQLLEEYCEKVYQMYMCSVEKKPVNEGVMLLSELLVEIKKSLEEEIKIRTEIVFLP